MSLSFQPKGMFPTIKFLHWPKFMKLLIFLQQEHARLYWLRRCKGGAVCTEPTHCHSSPRVAQASLWQAQTHHRGNPSLWERTWLLWLLLGPSAIKHMQKSTALISRCKILLGFHGSPFSASVPCSRFTLSTSGGIRAVFLRGILRFFPCSHDSWGRSMTQVSLFRIFTAKMLVEEFL